MFKIGIGPSSSHTMGPMFASGRFLQTLQSLPISAQLKRIECRLYGSLAFTGKGHGTDSAVMLGLLGEKPDEINPDNVEGLIDGLKTVKMISSEGLPKFRFDPALDLIFDYGPALEAHANGMKFIAYDKSDKEIFAETYYSIGGGFVLSDKEWHTGDEGLDIDNSQSPYPFTLASDMLDMAKKSGLSIAQMKEANELKHMSRIDLETGLDDIWAAMNSCLDRGLRLEGVLPGGLFVKRRAKAVRDSLYQQWGRNDAPPHIINDWISLFAMAVNEENAAGGRVVTAPTNGAAGVIPAVMRYYLDFCPNAQPEKTRDFLLTAAAIGGLIKHNASISGAEVGCQGEVGSASAMAAAGLCAVLGGTASQVENAAEIALEHHLGMTCDPISGLVQIPCIERNGLGAVKAVTAASLALRGDGTHFVPLDSCIETLRQTGLDLSEKYKETSLGGLAVTVVAC